MWKEWELRLLILLSLFVQLTLTSLGSKRKTSSTYWIQFVVWTTYLLADSIAILTLGVLSNRLANIKEMKGTLDPKSQITAFWAPFLLLHLGGPDTITAYALADNELWLRQLARFCVKLGLASYIYFMALSGSALSILAQGMILVGFIKYAERTLCMYLASSSRLRDLLQPVPKIGPVYSRKMEQYALKKEEGYRVRTEEVTEIEDFSVYIGQAYEEEKARTLVQAYELFKIFKLLFMGLVLNSGDLKASKRVFMDPGMNSKKAFEIVEIELGFMYDLLYTKVPLLNRAWGIIRWIINLSVPCTVLVLLVLQDRKSYAKVDVRITFLLLSVTILLEIYSLLQAFSSDWVDRWLLQRPRGSTISSAVGFLRFLPSQRWEHSVAQLSFLRLIIGKRNRIFQKCARLKLDEKVGNNFNITYREFKMNSKEWILSHLRELPEERRLVTLKEDVSRLLKVSNLGHLTWSVEAVGFEQSIIIWHIATELCNYEDRDRMKDEMSEYVTEFKMSKLVSRYRLYLLVFHPSKLPMVIGEIRYRDTLVDAQKFFEDRKEDTKKAPPSGRCGCTKAHKSRESRHLCKVYRLLLQMRTDLPPHKLRADKSTSVLFDAFHLACQLKEDDRKWNAISRFWAKMLICSVRETKGYEHCDSLSRGGELLSHIWLLMAHLGIVQTVHPPGGDCITKLIVK
ncbi:hypothetical protein EUGRSUZ_B02717 [Eucalyptus grandis]|uniref:DUF4220 domain-containing protein n=2 Tax=Eucalyptus grandis TaxID=71139 RepID=A0A059D731_EUCGR|nr:hypothetical protein EUGRSUZ_B02717 [Eucalyptus grandis]